MLKGGVIMDVTNPRAGEDRRGGGRRGRHGARAHPRGHPRGGRRGAHERPQDDRRHPGGRLHPRHGQVPHRPLCGGADAARPSRSTTSTRARSSPRPTTFTTSTRRSSTCPSSAAPRDLGEALRRIDEGASMIRTKGEPGTGDVVQAVRHMRTMSSEIAPRAKPARGRAVSTTAKELQAALRAGASTSTRTAGCPWSTSPPAASPPRPTRRS